MKTIIPILLLITNVLNAQVTILSTDFNQGIPTGWQLIDNDNLPPYNNPNVNFMTEAWNVVEDYDSIATGDSILVATSWFQQPGTADDYLISPPVTLGNYGNFVSFEIKSYDANNPDGFEVLYSTSGTTIADFTANPVVFRIEAATPYWHRYNVNLDSLNINNQTVYFAFRHFANDQYILMLDNISVTINDPVGIGEFNTKTLNIYPNPSNGTFTVEEGDNGDEIHIYTIEGILVETYKLTGNKAIITTELPAGFYFVESKGKLSKLQVVK